MGGGRKSEGFRLRKADFRQPGTDAERGACRLTGTAKGAAGQQAMTKASDAPKRGDRTDDAPTGAPDRLCPNIWIGRIYLWFRLQALDICAGQPLMNRTTSCPCGEVSPSS